MATQTQEPGATTQQTAADFPQATDPYRRELLAHCYRMTGSVHDAEDLVQETYLRAWRAYHGFEGRSSVRTWLYRIATNVCLSALEGRARRPLPAGLGAPSSEGTSPLEENGEIPWLEPVPDAMVGAGSAGDPLAAVTERESIRLAFVAALQHLPARQRAVLVLRDVLRWKAAEVAEAMDTTTVSVNSALQRAHATLAKADLHLDDAGDSPAGAAGSDLTPERAEMLERYVDAFWRKDVDAIVSMLTRDAIWEMPPFTGWYQGAENIGRLIAGQCPGGAHDMRMLSTRANGQPAFGLYMRGADNRFRPFHLQVLTLGRDGIEHVGAFFDANLFATFGLPDCVSEDGIPCSDPVTGPGVQAGHRAPAH